MKNWKPYKAPGRTSIAEWRGYLTAMRVDGQPLSDAFVERWARRFAALQNRMTEDTIRRVRRRL